MVVWSALWLLVWIFFWPSIISFHLPSVSHSRLQPTVLPRNNKELEQYLQTRPVTSTTFYYKKRNIFDYWQYRFLLSSVMEILHQYLIFTNNKCAVCYRITYPRDECAFVQDDSLRIPILWLPQWLRVSFCCLFPSVQLQCSKWLKNTGVMCPVSGLLLCWTVNLSQPLVHFTR